MDIWENYNFNIDEKSNHTIITDFLNQSKTQLYLKSKGKLNMIFDSYFDCGTLNFNVNISIPYLNNYKFRIFIIKDDTLNSNGIVLIDMNNNNHNVKSIDRLITEISKLISKSPTYDKIMNMYKMASDEM